MRTKHKSLYVIVALTGVWFGASPVAAQRIMTLEECVAAARTGNTQAKDAKNEILMAKEQQKLARSKYAPMASLSAFHFESNKHLVEYDALDQEDVDYLNRELGTDLNVDQFTASFIKRGTSADLTVIEPLYVGGRITKNNKLADLQVEARQLQQGLTDDQIVMNTESMYYKILELHETDKTLEAMEKELGSIHQDAINLWENGIANKNDVLNVELACDRQSALRIKVDNSRKLLRRALAQYIGMPDTDIDIDTTLNKEIVAPEQLLISTQTAMANRAESRLLDIWVEKSVLERKVARADMLPILAVGGILSHSRYLNEWNSRALGFVALQIPLSPLWSERHSYNRKKIMEQKAIDFRQDKRELMSLQIQDAYDNLTSAYKQTQIAQKSIVKAEENMRINREHYREGLTTMTNLLDAQRQQQQAHTQYNSALSEYLQAKTRYLILTGRSSK